VLSCLDANVPGEKRDGGGGEGESEPERENEKEVGIACGAHSDICRIVPGGVTLDFECGVEGLGSGWPLINGKKIVRNSEGDRAGRGDG